MNPIFLVNNSDEETVMEGYRKSVLELIDRATKLENRLNILLNSKSEHLSEMLLAKEKNRKPLGIPSDGPHYSGIEMAKDAVKDQLTGRPSEGDAK